jgi:DNA-binding MarR family transcriptional regulator
MAVEHGVGGAGEPVHLGLRHQSGERKRNLRGLEAAGLVEIAVADKDLRRRAVWLTEHGARRLETAIPLWRQAHAELAKRLDPKLARRLSEAAQALAGIS